MAKEGMSLERLVDLKPRKSDWARYVTYGLTTAVGLAGVASALYGPTSVKDVYEMLTGSTKVAFTFFGVVAATGLKFLADELLQLLPDTKSGPVYYDDGYFRRRWKYSGNGQLIHPVNSAEQLKDPSLRKQLVFVNGVKFERYNPAEQTPKGREASTLRSLYQDTWIAAGTLDQHLRDRLSEEIAAKPVGHSLYVLGQYSRGNRTSERKRLQEVGAKHGVILKLLDFGPALTTLPS